MNSQELSNEYGAICDYVTKRVEDGLSHEDAAEVYERAFDKMASLVEFIIQKLEKSEGKGQFTDWVAVLYEEDGDPRWCIAPQDFWDEHHYVPDDCIEFNVPGFFEAAEHVLRPLDTLSIEEQGEALSKLGFKVLKDVHWYFD